MDGPFARFKYRYVAMLSVETEISIYDISYTINILHKI